MYENIFQLYAVGLCQGGKKVVSHWPRGDNPFHLYGNRLGFGRPYNHRNAVWAVGLCQNQGIGACLDLTVGNAEYP